MPINSRHVDQSKYNPSLKLMSQIPTVTEEPDDGSKKLDSNLVDPDGTLPMEDTKVYKMLKPYFEHVSQHVGRVDLVKELDFSNKIKTGTLRPLLFLLTRFTSLSSLSLACNYLGTDSFKDLELLDLMKQLRSIDLTNNCFERLESEIFLNRLFLHPTLTSINLNGCLDSASLGCISNILETNRSIVDLSVGDTNVEPAHIGSLFKGLIKNTTLQSLDIHKCKIDSKCISQLADSLDIRKVSLSLNMCGMKFPTDDVVTVFDTLLSDVINQNISLVGLNIDSWNTSLMKGFDTALILTFAHNLKFNYYLQRLDLSKWVFSLGTFGLLLSGIKYNAAILHLVLVEVKLEGDRGVTDANDACYYLALCLSENSTIISVNLTNSFADGGNSGIFWYYILPTLKNNYVLEELILLSVAQRCSGRVNPFYVADYLESQKKLRENYERKRIVKVLIMIFQKIQSVGAFQDISFSFK
jgi:hypothetical protein